MNLLNYFKKTEAIEAINKIEDDVSKCGELALHREKMIKEGKWGKGDETGFYLFTGDEALMALVCDELLRNKAMTPINKEGLNYVGVYIGDVKELIDVLDESEEVAFRDVLILREMYMSNPANFVNGKNKFWTNRHEYGLGKVMRKNEDLLKIKESYLYKRDLDGDSIREFIAEHDDFIDPFPIVGVDLYKYFKKTKDFVAINSMSNLSDKYVNLVLWRETLIEENKWTKADETAYFILTAGCEGLVMAQNEVRMNAGRTGIEVTNIDPNNINNVAIHIGEISELLDHLNKPDLETFAEVVKLRHSYQSNPNNYVDGKNKYWSDRQEYGFYRLTFGNNKFSQLVESLDYVKPVDDDSLNRYLDKWEDELVFCLELKEGKVESVNVEKAVDDKSLYSYLDKLEDE